jgi:hypothetical protein
VPRPQPRLGPAIRSPAWATFGLKRPLAISSIRLNLTIIRLFRKIKMRHVRSFRNPSSFFCSAPSILTHTAAAAAGVRHDDGGGCDGGDGTALGPLAGACARPWLSMPPSSSRMVVPGFFPRAGELVMRCLFPRGGGICLARRQWWWRGKPQVGHEPHHSHG